MWAKGIRGFMNLDNVRAIRANNAKVVLAYEDGQPWEELLDFYGAEEKKEYEEADEAQRIALFTIWKQNAEASAAALFRAWRTHPTCVYLVPDGTAWKPGPGKSEENTNDVD